MNCSPIIPNGSARNACITDSPTNLFIMKLGETFSNYLDVQNEETWRKKIQDDLTVYPTLPMRTVTPTKASANKETEGSGAEVTTRINPGGAVVNLKAAICDFKEILLAMQGAEYAVVIGLGGNKVMVLEDSKGVMTGFTGQVTAIPVGAPAHDAKLEQFQLDINWADVNEWYNYRIIELPFMLNDLVTYTPLGLDAKIVTPLIGSAMELNISLRCQNENETETLVAELKPVNGANVADPIVTLVATTNGGYTATVENGATTPLVEGEYITYRAVLKDTDIYEKLSGWITAKL